MATSVLSAFVTVTFATLSLMAYEEKHNKLSVLYAILAAVFMALTVLP